MPRSFKDILHTLGHFLRAPQEIGAVLPSSPFLARRMMDALNLSHAQVVVELGAGTGAITNELLKRVQPAARVVIIDSNAEAIAILKARLSKLSNIELILGDAKELRRILSDIKLTRVDAIVSSLPYASMNETTARVILSEAADLLSPEGHFVAFQYTPILRKTLETYFKIQSSEVEIINFPPAIVYKCISRSAPAAAAQEQKSA